MRPEPPNDAAPQTPIPPVGFDGTRQTVNANLSTAQTTWNLRSGLNVAALNCLDPEHALILNAYTVLLKAHEKHLTATNRALDAEFRATYGTNSRDIRDQYMTRVYNYFALPPAQDAFCDAALQISRNYLTAPPADLDVYAANTLPQLEAAFVQFFDAFENYRVAAAEWDARYGIPSQSVGFAMNSPAQSQVSPIASAPVAPSAAAPAVDQALAASTVSTPVVQALPTSDRATLSAPAAADSVSPVAAGVLTGEPSVTEPAAPAPAAELASPPPSAASEAVSAETVAPVVASPFSDPAAPAPTPAAPAAAGPVMVSNPVVQPVADGETD
jgi:hypothetical protein